MPIACFGCLRKTTGYAWRAEIVNVQPTPSNAEEEECGPFGISHGLSKPDFMLRQRYFENSGLDRACSHAVSIASQPLEPRCASSKELHVFIQEQRKIISTFRAQPWPMQMKLAAFRSYKHNVSKYVPHLNTIDTFRDSSRQVLKKLKCKWHAFWECLTIWGSIIKRIEGNFGTSVASFFTFLRWLCALNLVLTVMVLGFLVLPQVVSGHGLDVPLSVRRNGSAISFLLDGKGYVFEYSVLFYGYYDSGQHEPYLPPPPNPKPYIGVTHYKLPLAYLSVIAALFLVCVVALLFNMAEKYKLMQRANASEQYPFSWKVFASWDFAITDANTSASKKKHTTVSLKETLVEEKRRELTGINVKQWVIRGLTNALVLLCLVSTSYAIFLAVENAEETDAAQTRNFSQAISGGWTSMWLFFLSFQVQAVVIGRNFLLPYVFMVAEQAEKLHPRTALKIMLLRMFLLYLSSLYVLIIALFTLSKQCVNNSDVNLEDGSCCWETVIGQELYKLSLTHLLADMAGIAFVDGFRWLISKFRTCERINNWIGQAEFRLADNILKLVYSQALILLGVLFCPLLPAIGFLKNIVLFYCRAFAVYYFNKPPRTLFRVASTRNFYLALLLLTVFLCVLPVGYAVVQMTPSKSCGPFRGLPNMLELLFDEASSWPPVLQTAFEYTQTATVVVPVMVLLAIMIYYYAALTHALKEVNKDLRLQLRVEQNETRDRIAKEAHAARPRTMERRHQELQKAIQTELMERQRKRHMGLTQQRVVSRPQPQCQDPHTPDSQEYLPQEWGTEVEQGGNSQTAVYVDPPRAPTQVEHTHS